MLPVVDMVARWALISRGVLERNVSLYYRGLWRLRHDQVCVVPAEGVAWRLEGKFCFRRFSGRCSRSWRWATAQIWDGNYSCYPLVHYRRALCCRLAQLDPKCVTVGCSALRTRMSQSAYQWISRWLSRGLGSLMHSTKSSREVAE